MLYRSHPIVKAPMEVEKIYQMDAALTENQILACAASAVGVSTTMYMSCHGKRKLIQFLNNEY